MTAAIVLTGFSANDPVPGVVAEINFAQGPAAGSGSQRSVLLLGNKRTTGSAVVDAGVYGPDTAIPMQTEADCITLFGAGSEVHRMFRRFTKVNKDTSLYAMAVTESAGNQATATCTIATTAAGNGSHRLWCGDGYVDTSILTGDLVGAIAAAIKANVNAMTHWPITADNTDGVLTLTAKQKGLRGNDIRVQCAITGSSVTTTTTLTAATLMTGGTTADSWTAALAAINPMFFYYIVCASNPSTAASGDTGNTSSLAALTAQVDLQAAPTTGIRQRVIAGSSDPTLATALTVAAINSARAEIAWQQSSDWTSAEIAANHAAVVALFEAESYPTPLHNFSGFGKDIKTATYWHVPAPRSGLAPTRATIKAALLGGVTPIGSGMIGSTYLVKRITTRHLTGSTPDYRVRDSHKVTVCDFFTDDLIAKTILQHSGKDIADDNKQGQPAPGPKVITPSRYRNTINGLLDTYGGNDQLQNVDAIKAGTIVQREASPPTRMSVRIPLQPIDIADQFAIAVDQVA